MTKDQLLAAIYNSEFSIDLRREICLLVQEHVSVSDDFDVNDADISVLIDLLGWPIDELAEWLSLTAHYLAYQH